MSEGLFSGGSGAGRTCSLGKDSSGNCYEALLSTDSSGNMITDLVGSSAPSTASKWSNILSAAGKYLEDDEDTETSASPQITINGIDVPRQQATTFDYSPLLTGDIQRTGRMVRAK